MMNIFGFIDRVKALWAFGTGDHGVNEARDEVLGKMDKERLSELRWELESLLQQVETHLGYR